MEFLKAAPREPAAPAVGGAAEAVSGADGADDPYAERPTPVRGERLEAGGVDPPLPAEERERRFAIDLGDGAPARRKWRAPDR